MRKTLLIVVVLAASSAAGTAEARGRSRFRLPWFSSRASASDASKPTQAAGAGGLVVLPFAARADSQRTAEPPSAPASKPPEPSEPKRGPVEAAAPKPKPCAASSLFGDGNGFCAVN